MIRIRTMLAVAGLIAVGTAGAQEPKAKSKPATPAPAAASDTTHKKPMAKKASAKKDTTAAAMKDTTHKMAKPAAKKPAK